MVPPTTDRLSALDSAFLALDTPRAPLHVGWTMRFDGPAPSLSALRRHLEARLHLVPRFRRTVRSAVLGLGDATWVDDPAFDLANHVHAIAVAPPGGAGELRRLAGTLLSQRLDPARPLWRMYLVDGVGDGFALIGQAHHALVDGIAAIEVAMLLFAPDSGETTDDARAWTPAPAPGTVTTTRDALDARLRLGVQAVRALADAARHPQGIHMRDAGAAIEALARPAPVTALDHTETARRAVAFAQTSLDGVREAGRRHGATINDVLLTACSLALREALRRRGDVPASLKVMVPVNVRGDESAATLGNRISFMAVDLPISEHEPVRALRAVRDATRAQKTTGSEGPLDLVSRAANMLPTAGTRAIARSVLRLASFNVIISNMPGPSVTLELLGRPLTAVFPAVPIPEGNALAVGALSYRDRLNVGVYADAEVVPDTVDVARDLEAAFDALRMQAATAPTPWRVKARAKRAGLRDVSAPQPTGTRVR